MTGAGGGEKGFKREQQGRWREEVSKATIFILTENLNDIYLYKKS